MAFIDVAYFQTSEQAPRRSAYNYTFSDASHSGGISVHVDETNWIGSFVI